MKHAIILLCAWVCVYFIAGFELTVVGLLVSIALEEK